MQNNCFRKKKNIFLKTFKSQHFNLLLFTAILFMELKTGKLDNNIFLREKMKEYQKKCSARKKALLLNASRSPLLSPNADQKR